MAISIIDKTDTDGATSEYPYGNIRDQLGTIDGTPVSVETYGDFHQFFAKMFDESGLTYNNLPDNDYNGFQLWEALVQAIQNQQVYDRYYVKLSQSGTSAPTVDNLHENDLSVSPAWSYVGVGVYDATFGSSVFPDSTKVLLLTPSGKSGDTITAEITSSTVLRVRTSDAAGAAKNGVLQEHDIFVRVYP